MKRNQLYRQCRLVKRLREGEAVQTSYLPAEFARVGRFVKVQDQAGGWDDGWIIREIETPEWDIYHDREPSVA